MAAQLVQIQENIPGTVLIPKSKTRKSVKKETYVIYSIYYSTEPEGGHVVYSNDQDGWEFYGYMPAVKSKEIPTHQRLVHTERGL
jgi:hypothetical protein